MRKRILRSLVAFLCVWIVVFPQAAMAQGDTKYSIDVDVTNQVVTVYGKDSQGRYNQVVRQMICSTGRNETPTPIGDFRATSRREWAYMTEAEVYVKYATRIFRDYFFHSLLFEQQDDSTLIRSSYENLGKKASHGCIRLLIEDAKWIYDHAEYGTPVRVYEGEKDAKLTKKLKPTGAYTVKGEGAASAGETEVAANPKPTQSGGKADGGKRADETRRADETKRPEATRKPSATKRPSATKKPTAISSRAARSR